ncbi:MAG TPA: hypothetical protein DCQ31_16950 [Bacteroidales bacterium]|nr:hypothetical protein [Bacteroidales bacterium]
MKNEQDHGGKIVSGTILIIVGVFFLLYNLGYIDFKWWTIFYHWQTWLIFIGLALLSSRSSRFTGVILLVIGGLFLIPEFYDLPFDVKKIFWPTALIVVGIGIFFTGMAFKKNKNNNELN